MYKKRKKISYFFKKGIKGLPFDINPVRDWKLMLALFIFLMSAITSANIFFFFQVQSGEIFKAEETSSLYFEEINTERLNNLSDFFSEKRDRFRTLVETVELSEESNPLDIQSENDNQTEQENLPIDQE